MKKATLEQDNFHTFTSGLPKKHCRKKTADSQRYDKSRALHSTASYCIHKIEFDITAPEELCRIFPNHITIIYQVSPTHLKLFRKDSVVSHLSPLPITEPVRSYYSHKGTLEYSREYTTRVDPPVCIPYILAPMMSPEAPMRICQNPWFKLDKNDTNIDGSN